MTAVSSDEAERTLTWLGRSFQELLPQLRSEERKVSIALTRPSARAWGKGQLRVVRVKDSELKLELLLAYERYQYDESKNRGKRKN